MYCIFSLHILMPQTSNSNIFHFNNLHMSCPDSHIHDHLSIIRFHIHRSIYQHRHCAVNKYHHLWDTDTFWPVGYHCCNDNCFLFPMQWFVYNELKKKTLPLNSYLANCLKYPLFKIGRLNHFAKLISVITFYWLQKLVGKSKQIQ